MQSFIITYFFLRSPFIIFFFCVSILLWLELFFLHFYAHTQVSVWVYVSKTTREYTKNLQWIAKANKQTIERWNERANEQALSVARNNTKTHLITRIINFVAHSLFIHVKISHLLSLFIPFCSICGLLLSLRSLTLSPLLVSWLGSLLSHFVLHRDIKWVYTKQRHNGAIIMLALRIRCSQPVMHRFVRPLVVTRVCVSVCVCCPRTTRSHSHTRQLISISNRTYKMNSGCLWRTVLCLFNLRKERINGNRFLVPSPFSLWIHALHQRWVLISMNWIEKFKGNSFNALSLSLHSLDPWNFRNILNISNVSIYWKLFAPNQKNESKNNDIQRWTIYIHFAMLAPFFKKTKSFSSENMFAGTVGTRTKKILFKVLNEMKKERNENENSKKMK